MEEIKARITEIFYSIQGEGIYVGYPQVFVRFSGCNLENCRFCDTPGREYKEMDIQELIEYIIAIDKNYHSISLTGGEPLLQIDFLERFLEVFNTNHRIYLETNGTLPQNLERIIHNVDIVAMDIKLPSATGLPPYWDAHRRFLLIAWEKTVFVKTVITKNTVDRDLEEAVELILSVDPNIPLVLQPATEELDEDLFQKLLDYQQEASKSLFDVRIIPQVQRLISVK
ncbi:MAG TPA: 7-carboxy-7-deazaguanine synthase QueE [Candidatus Omnitrophica bacterium]|nr:7-carboxy-7-deazaguanine synthase QueE [Candidatus Omnitrophota bacterium]